MSFICRVISSPIVYVWAGTRRIVHARNSLMASSLSLVCVLCSTLTISSFPVEIEKNIQAMKISSGEPKIDRRNPRWLDHGFSFAQISSLLWSFSHFWSSFIEIKVLNERENSILHILYCYSLKQHIFLAFCIDFDTHYRVSAYSLYILLRNKILLFPQ